MKYKKDQPVTYIPLQKRAVVDHVTPYHDADDQHATVTIRLLDSGDLRTVPVAVQDKYITTEAPKPKWKVWPLAKASSK